MEQQVQKDRTSTKADQTENARTGVLLSRADAEEFRMYKKQKKMTEISLSIARSESSVLGGEDVGRVCERAARLRQSAVKVPLSKLAQAKYYLSGSKVSADCVVGGTGETLAKVKAYEAKLAVRRGAKEITLRITPSLLDCCRYSEIRKEIRRVKRAAGRACLKVWADKAFSPTALSRVARIASESGAKYFCVPYHQGCERLRMDMTRGCQLEVMGVESFEEFKRLSSAGVGRIVTDRAAEIYADWVKEANSVTIEDIAMRPQTPPSSDEKSAMPAISNDEAEKVEKVEKTDGTLSAQTPSKDANCPTVVCAPSAPSFERKYDPSETEYRCRVEGTGLKFF